MKLEYQGSQIKNCLHHMVDHAGTAQQDLHGTALHCTGLHCTALHGTALLQ